MSPKWPFEVKSLVSIDSQPAVTVDLTDNSVLPRDFDTSRNASSPSIVVWSATGLPNGTHNVLITRDDNDDGMIIVDGFVYVTPLFPPLSLTPNFLLFTIYPDLY